MTEIKKILAGVALLATISFPITANAALTLGDYHFVESGNVTQNSIYGYADCSGVDYYNINYVDSETITNVIRDYSGRQPRKA